MNCSLPKALASLAAAMLLAAAVAWFVQFRTINRLESANHDLAAQQLELTRDRDAALGMATKVADENARARDAQAELLKLRSEAGRLPGLSNELEKARIENAQLRARLAAGESQTLSAPPAPSAAEGRFPLEAWANAGYASPEAAIRTWVWAMDKGDKKAMLESLAPEQQSQWSKILESASETDFHRQSPISAIDVVDVQTVNDTEAVLTLVNELPDGSKTAEQKMMIHKVGSDWKIAGPAQP